MTCLGNSVNTWPADWYRCGRPSINSAIEPCAWARVFEIGARRKRAAGLVASQHRDPDFGIRRHLVAAPGDFLVEILSPGVAGLGPAKGQPTDMAAFFVKHRHCK